MQGSLGDENNDSAEVLKVSAGLLNNTILVLTQFMPGARGVIRVSQGSRYTSYKLALLPLLTGNVIRREPISTLARQPTVPQ